MSRPPSAIRFFHLDLSILQTTNPQHAKRARSCAYHRSGVNGRPISASFFGPSLPTVLKFYASYACPAGGGSPTQTYTSPLSPCNTLDRLLSKRFGTKRFSATCSSFSEQMTPHPLRKKYRAVFRPPSRISVSKLQ